MTGVVHIVDFGAGNLYSVARAVEKVGYTPCVTDSPFAVQSAERLILPGVGAFRDGMSGLAARGLDDAVRAYAQTGRPLLGICLGMQMLMTSSLEFGTHEGLGLVPGSAVPIPRVGVDQQPHKVPFIGWACLEINRSSQLATRGLAEPLGRGAVYLVHSFHCEVEDSTHSAAQYFYDGASVTAAVGKDNIVGMQFHPEKSGAIGLAALRDYLDMV